MVRIAGASISKKEQRWTWPWTLRKPFKDPWILGPPGWFKIPRLKRVTSSSAVFHQYTTGKYFVGTNLLQHKYTAITTIFAPLIGNMWRCGWRKFVEIGLQGWSVEWRWPLSHKYSTRNGLYQARERANQQYIHFWGSQANGKCKKKYNFPKHYISKWVQERWSPLRTSWTRHPGGCTTRLQPLVPTGSARHLEWTSLRPSTVEWI